MPFCARRCAYCDFHALPFSRSLAQPLWAAIIGHLRRLPAIYAEQTAGRPLSSIYIGGGTPSIWPAAKLGQLLEEAAQLFGVAGDAEISLEANPGSVSLGKLKSLAAAGFNRLSLGVQSFSPHSLALLGRSQRPGQAASSVNWARQAGFANLSLDVIYALPEQSLTQARQDVAEALRLQPEHLSLYQLTLSPATPLGRRYQPYQPPMPDEDTVLAMEEEALHLCGAAGLLQYEVSNFARPGFACRHNSSTWRGGDYLALGPGAHGHLQGVRWANHYDLPRYIQAWQPGGAGGQETLEQLNAAQRAAELFMLGLRTVKGVDLRTVEDIIKRPVLTQYEAAIASACQQGWVKLAGHYLRPTPLGLKMADRLALGFV